MAKVKAITFDLWDTLIRDGSDEPKRKEAGRLSKRDERRELVHRFLSAHAPIDRIAVQSAYDTADAAFNVVWKELHVTWTVPQRLTILLRGLGRELPEQEFAELARLHEEMELEFRPDFAPQAAEAVRTLAQRYRLGVISDAVFTPGRCLRRLLEDEGILDCFQAFVFSDEAGHSKPHPSVFEAAAAALGAAPDEMIHIGDREHNDVEGAHRFGSRAILCAAVIDRGSETTAADAVVRVFNELPAVITSLDRE